MRRHTGGDRPRPPSGAAAINEAQNDNCLAVGSAVPSPADTRLVEHLLTDVLLASRVSRFQLAALTAAATFARDFMPPLAFR